QAAQKIEDAGYRSETLKEIAKATAKAGEFDLALQAAQKIEDAGYRSLALKGIAVAMAEAGQFDRALQIAQKIERAWYRSWALTEIAEAMVEAGANLTLPLKWLKQLIFLLCAFKRLLTSWWRSGRQGREKRGRSKSGQQGKRQRIASSEWRIVSGE
ncbi:MAG: hypothetical protein LASZOEIN_002800, partial [Candidatus Fervidibacter sp.]